MCAGEREQRKFDIHKVGRYEYTYRLRAFRKKVAESLNELGEEASALSGILITHEHTDHIAGLKDFCGRYRIPVYVHEKGAEALVGRSGIDVRLLRPYVGALPIGDLFMEYLPLSHDAAYCVGYKLTGVRGSICTVTDTGCFPEGAENFSKTALLPCLKATMTVPC